MTMLSRHPMMSFDHDRRKLLRETQAKEMQAKLAEEHKQPEEPSWRRPNDDFTDRTLQRIMDRLDCIERDIASIVRNTRP